MRGGKCSVFPNNYNSSLFTLYLHRNKINGKVYVGITSKKRPEDRWGKNGCLYLRKGRSGRISKFASAILKYGWDNFSHEIILRDIPGRYEACRLEKMWVKKLRANESQFGYNSTSGGDIFIFSDEVKRMMSETRRGANNANYGHHMSDESKMVLRKKNGKKVICEQVPDIIFNSTSEAQEFFNIPDTKIRGVCVGYRKSIGCERIRDEANRIAYLTFRYVEDGAERDGRSASPTGFRFPGQNGTEIGLIGLEAGGLNEMKFNSTGEAGMWLYETGRAKTAHSGANTIEKHLKRSDEFESYGIRWKRAETGRVGAGDE